VYNNRGSAIDPRIANEARYDRGDLVPLPRCAIGNAADRARAPTRHPLASSRRLSGRALARAL